jgi:hypothetical protein
MMCACGKPLHYGNLKMLELVEQMVADMGENVEVVACGRRFKVPRHFIALHGLKATDLPTLAKLYGFEEVTGDV